MKFYTYLIGWKSLDKWYYGVRYSKDCHPSDLFVSYFTSSFYVKEFIKNFGMPDVVEVRRTFQTRQDAIAWEHKVLRRMAAVKKEKWLNRTDNKAILTDKHPTRGKTLKEIYGEEVATAMCEQKSKRQRGRKLSDITKQKISQAHLGKKLSEEHKQKIKMHLKPKLKMYCILSVCECCGRMYHQQTQKARFCSKACSNSARKIGTPFRELRLLHLLRQIY